MSSQDKTCVDCESEFTIEAGEIKFFEARDMNLPKRCPDCRAKRKAERENSGQ